MKIRWGIDTGYVTRIPDFELEIPDDELESLEDWEVEDLIEDYVQEEFDNRVHFYWRRA